MKVALYLMAALGLLGAFDTLYYHEWRARLPALGPAARSELQLHAWRDFVYAALFAGLPWLAWQGKYALLLAGLFAVEIALTLWDFVVEDWRTLRSILAETRKGKARLGTLGRVWRPPFNEYPNESKRSSQCKCPATRLRNRSRSVVHVEC